LKLATDIVDDCSRVKAPAVLITGEPQLDRVIDLRLSSDWLALIPGTRHVTIPGTGHIGLVSKPDEFADIVCKFVQENNRAS
jgi:pimeloyl-ACP methyl ester carboxylesterase